MQPTRVEAEFDDIDDLVESIDWDSELIQLEPGPAQYKVSVLAYPRVVVSEFNFSKSVSQRGLAPQGFSTFGLSPSETRLSWLGSDVPPSSLIDFHGQNGYEGVGGNNFLGVTVSFEQDFLEQVCNSMQIAVDSSRQLATPLVIKNDKFHSLRGFLGSLIRVPSDSSDDLPFAGLPLNPEEKILTQFLEVIDQGGEKTLCRSLPVRQRRLKRAVEYVEAQCENNPSMTAICESAFMSWRSLDRAFKERFGIGPKRYLMCVRLTRVRRLLKQAPPESRVSTIANELDFWHMGQFASDYKKLFGELPSETLRK